MIDPTPVGIDRGPVAYTPMVDGLCAALADCSLALDPSAAARSGPVPGTSMPFALPRRRLAVDE